MDQREMGGRGGDRPGGGSAGPANTPPFGDAQTTGAGEEAGYTAGSPGGERGGAAEEMHGIAAAREPTGSPGARTGAGQRTGAAPGEDVEGRVRERMGAMRDEVESRADEMMSRAAEGLDSAAGRIDEFAERQQGQGGAKGRMGRMAHGTAETIESVARYLRDNDVEGLQQDLERQVRSNPIQTLLIAVAAGWMVGKLLR